MSLHQCRTTKMEKTLQINIDCLKCPICLEVLNNPYIIPCPSKCVACKECIINVWNTHFEVHREVRILQRCLCNVEGIPINTSVSATGIEIVKKNIVQKCVNFKNRCPFFIDYNMNQAVMEKHLEICG